MRSIILILISVFSLAITAVSQPLSPEKKDSIDKLPFDYHKDYRAILEQTQDKSSPYYYKTQLIRYLNNDSSLSRRDILALMIGYTIDPKYKPFKDMQTEQDIFDLNDKGEYQEALEQSKVYLQKHPFSLRILKERSYSYHQLYIKDSADYFMNQVDKILGAMIYSGKGKSIDKAIFSLGLSDGEWFIADVGMSVNNKSTTWDKHKNFIYVVNSMDGEGTYENWYFNIQHAKIRIDDEGVDEETPMEKKKKGKKGDSKTVDNKAKDKGWGGSKDKKGKGKPNPETAAPADDTPAPATDSTGVPVPRIVEEPAKPADKKAKPSGWGKGSKSKSTKEKKAPVAQESETEPNPPVPEPPVTPPAPTAKEAQEQKPVEPTEAPKTSTENGNGN